MRLSLATIAGISTRCVGIHQHQCSELVASEWQRLKSRPETAAEILIPHVKPSDHYLWYSRLEEPNHLLVCIRQRAHYGACLARVLEFARNDTSWYQVGENARLCDVILQN